MFDNSLRQGTDRDRQILKDPAANRYWQHLNTGNALGTERTCDRQQVGTQTKSKQKTAAASDRKQLRLATVYCTTVYCTTVYCTTVYCTTAYCTTAYCTTVYCSGMYTRMFDEYRYHIRFINYNVPVPILSCTVSTVVTCTVLQNTV